MEKDITAKEIMELLMGSDELALEVNLGGKRMLVAKEEGNKHISAVIRFTPDELYEFMVDITTLAKAKGNID